MHFGKMFSVTSITDRVEPELDNRGVVEFIDFPCPKKALLFIVVGKRRFFSLLLNFFLKIIIILLKNMKCLN